MNTENRGEVFLPVRSSRRRNALWIASVALVYFVTARLSLLLEFQPEGIAAIWPPEGIFLSALLLTRRGVRGYLAGTLYVADLAAERLAGTPLVVAALYALALTGNAVLSSWLLRRFLGGAPTFTKVREVFGFLVLAVILSNSLWSLVAAAASELLPGTSSFWGSWTWWAASDGVGNLLVTPLLLSWVSWATSRSRPASPKRLLEGAALFVPLALLNFLAFRHRGAAGPLSLLLPYVTFPFLLWAAVRFGVRGVTSALVIIAAIAVSFVAAGPAPGFPFDGSRLSGIIVVQLYLAILAVPSLLLVAAVSERQRAEETLRQLSRRNEEALRVARMGHWELDLAREVFTFNDQYYTLHGMTAREAGGYQMTAADFARRYVHPDDAHLVQEHIQQALAADDPDFQVQAEARILRMDGKTRWVTVWFRIEKDAQGRTIKLYGVNQDITERKRAEEALRESEERYRILLEHGFDGIFVHEDYRIVQLNDRLAEMTGYTRAELLGANGLDLFTPDSQERVRQYISSGSAGSYEIALQRRDGCLLEVEAYGASCQFQGRPARIVGLRDVTERKQAEESLRESEERFRTAFEEGTVPMALTALDSTLLKVNSAFCRMLGFSESELVGRSFTEITHPDDVATNLVGIGRLACGEISSFRMEKRYLRKDGAIVWGDMSTASVRDDQDRPLYCVTHIQDVTDRRQAEESLRELNATLEAKVTQRTEDLRHTVGRLRELTLELSQAEDRERKRIAGILHEDVQQTLAAAKFHLNLLDSEPRRAEEFREIVGQVKYLLKDAIEKSRDLSHELSPALYQVDLLEILNWLARHVQQEHGLTVRVEAHGPVDSPSEPLKAFLYKVAQELLFNVVKHAGVREARVRVRRMGPWIYLSVVDRGRGFDPQDLVGAAGFGLLSIRERVHLLGGRMKIRSRPGMGSRLVIVVPDQETSRAPVL